MVDTIKDKISYIFLHLFVRVPSRKETKLFVRVFLKHFKEDQSEFTRSSLSQFMFNLSRRQILIAADDKFKLIPKYGFKGQGHTDQKRQWLMGRRAIVVVTAGRFLKQVCLR